jgi:hypothetical protein
MKHKWLLYAFILATLATPMVNAVTIDGPTNFRGPHGGDVRLDNVVTSNTVNIVNWVFSFNNYREGGTNYGLLGFGVSTGDVLTLQNVQTRRISYNVSGASTSYVMYPSAGEPDQVTGGTFTYNAVNETTIVTTTGAGGVIIEWSPEQTSLYHDLLTYMGVAALIPVIVAAAYLMDVYRTGNWSNAAFGVIVGLIAAMTVIAYMLAQYV